MRLTPFALAVAGSLVLGIPCGTGRDPVSTDTQVRSGASRPMTDGERRHLDRIIAAVEKRQMLSLTVEARTMEEARKLADVDKKDDWEAEYNGWFVFTSTIGNGRPFFWDVTLVKKGTNKVAYFHEVW